MVLDTAISGGRQALGSWTPQGLFCCRHDRRLLSPFASTIIFVIEMYEGPCTLLFEFPT